MYLCTSRTGTLRHKRAKQPSHYLHESLPQLGMEAKTSMLEQSQKQADVTGNGCRLGVRGSRVWEVPSWSAIFRKPSTC